MTWPKNTLRIVCALYAWTDQSRMPATLTSSTCSSNTSSEKQCCCCCRAQVLALVPALHQHQALDLVQPAQLQLQHRCLVLQQSWHASQGTLFICYGQSVPVSDLADFQAALVLAAHPVCLALLAVACLGQQALQHLGKSAT